MSFWPIVVILGILALGLYLLVSGIAQWRRGKSRWLSGVRSAAGAVATVIGLLALLFPFSRQSSSNEAARGPVSGAPLSQSATPEAQPGASAAGDAKHKKTASARAEESALSTAKQAFDTGSIAYHPPSNMVQGSTQRFELLISRTPDAALAAKLESRDNAVIDAITTGAVMGATLDGPASDFAIVLLGGSAAQDQALGASSPARWEWDVTALTPGDHDLDLTVYIKVRNPETDTVVSSNLVVRHSVVHVAVRQKTFPDYLGAVGHFTAANWDKLWTLILVPVVGWYLHRRHKRNKTVAERETQATAEDHGGRE